MSARRPLEVAVTDLRTHPATRRAFRRRVELADLTISTAVVPSGGEIEVDLILESTGTDVVASGTITAPWVGPCRRCLTPVEGTAETVVREIFEPRPTEGETYELREDSVDLEPLVRDAVLLALPLAPLCRPDCSGPAPEQFPTGPRGDAGTDDREASPDPRWAALDELRFED